MKYTELAVEGALLVSPAVHSDGRGRFLEQFNSESFERQTGRRLTAAQMNLAYSRAGAVRGMHFYSLPGQSYYVACVSGAVVDIVLDVRVGSATFGEYVTAELDADNHQALFVAEGLAHGIAPRTGDATFVFLTSSLWDPEAQRRINPLDPKLKLPWPSHPGRRMLLAEKDRSAPTLAEAQEQGILPSYAACAALYDDIARRRGPSRP